MAWRQSLVPSIRFQSSFTFSNLMAVPLPFPATLSVQATPAHFRSELESYQKVQRTTMLDHLDPGESADGDYPDQEPTSEHGYECCWKAPNPLLARYIA